MMLALLILWVVTFTLLLVACARLEHVQGEVRAEVARHEQCHSDVYATLSALQGSREGKVLREAARLWEAPETQSLLRKISMEQYVPGGTSVPALFLQHMADTKEAAR